MEQHWESLVKAICLLINTTIDPYSSNAARIQANMKLNSLTTTDIHKNADMYINVALALIAQKDAKCGQFSHNNPEEMYIHYGFKMISDLVKYNWYQFDQAKKYQLKQACIEWCLSRLFCRIGSTSFPSKISTSSVVLNSCSLAITEIFIREWPQNWPTFLNELTKMSSLVSMYSLLNISEYLHSLHIPANPDRRNEIIKSLIQYKESIYKYLQQCLSIQDSRAIQDIKLTIEYRQLLVLKTLETLESLFEWFDLNKEFIDRIIKLVTISPLNVDLPFYNKVKILSYRCIQSIIKQTKANQPNDMAIILELFYDCSPDHFLNNLITNILGNYLQYSSSIEDNPQLYELFTLALDIGVEIICHVIELFNNKDATNSTVYSSILRNQNLWKAFFNFTLECLRYNNASFDEVLLKFLVPYCELRREGEKDAKLFSPIDPSVDQQFPEQILLVIGQCKIVAKSQTEAAKRELSASFQLDSYESYLTLFNMNRSKFFSMVHGFVRRKQDVCHVYVANVLREMLGPVESETPDCNNNLSPVGVHSWNVVAMLFDAIFPNLSPPPKYTAIFGAYFERLLEVIKNLTKEESTLLSVLSVIFYLSPYYNKVAESKMLVPNNKSVYVESSGETETSALAYKNRIKQLEETIEEKDALIDAKRKEVEDFKAQLETSITQRNELGGKFQKLYKAHRNVFAHLSGYTMSNIIGLPNGYMLHHIDDPQKKRPLLIQVKNPDTDKMTFELLEDKMDADFLSSLRDKIQNYLTGEDEASYPAFLASLTLDFHHEKKLIKYNLASHLTK